MGSLTETIDFKALLYALSRQSAPLPIELQQQLTQIARSIHANPNQELAIELDRLIANYQPLEREYQQAIADLQQQYISQERAKSIGVNTLTELDAEKLFIDNILPGQDWVKNAKSLFFQQSDRQKSSRFLKRGDRVVTLASGGAFLGVLIAQIPGAIVGGLLAGIYAWWSYPTANTDGNS